MPINKKHSLVLDIGTTGIKAFVFDDDFNVLSKAYRPLDKKFPKNGWVEQDPFELLEASKEVLKQAVKESNLSEESFVGVGLTNQRETTILWDKTTGKPVYPAIVWEDKRTDDFCNDLKDVFGDEIREKTGLSIDPYFSATKIWWILENIKESKEILDKNNLFFGTVDTWIMWNLIEGNPNLTDHTNASRTLLFNIKTLDWDKNILEIFKVPKLILPHIKKSQDNFGNLKKDILGFSLPFVAVCGDQQASLYAAGKGQGITKITFGTGTFIMQEIGEEFSIYDGFFTTLTASDKQPEYAIEGKIEFYGKTIQDSLNDSSLLREALEKLVKMVDESVKLLPIKPRSIVIDGGVTRREELGPMISDKTGIPVIYQKIFDGTALGVAKLIFKK